jgi:CRISPR-associated protein Cas1
MQLFIKTPGTLIRQKDECFRLQSGDSRCDISPMKIESIVISNKALISTQAIDLALSNNIDVVFLDSYGDPVGRIWFSKMGSTALIRRKQIEAAENALGFQVVKEMISRKLKNQVDFLKKLMYARPGKQNAFSDAIAAIDNAISELNTTESEPDQFRNRIMGLEGVAGRVYFQSLSWVVPEKYKFSSRSRRPAKDPFNAVLNYCYGILYSRVEKACIIAGLDPFVGFLHTDNYNKKSLVFDLIEPFRIFAELPAVYLFTGRKIKDDFFQFEDNAVSLNQAGKPLIVDVITKHLEDRVRFRRKNVKRKHIIQHEAHRLANILLDPEKETVSKLVEIKEF